MKEPTQRELLLEVRQAILGIPDTEEKGMSGDMSEVKNHLIKLNNSVAKNTAFRKVTMYIGSPLIVAVILKLIGLY